MTGAKTHIWSATPTPFLADGAIDPASIERVVEQHVRIGVEGLFLAGTCGEGPFMLNEQRADLVKKTKRAVRGRMRLAVQVSDTSAARVLANMRAAEQAGADEVIIAPPWIARFANADFTRRYFFEPIEKAPLPVGVYVLKQPADSALGLEMWRELAAHPKVRLLKDSSASDEYRDAFVAVKAKRPGLTLLTGYEFAVLPAVEAGYDGCLLGTGILIGGMIRRAMDALVQGDRAAAESWQKRSNEFLWDLFRRDLSGWLGGLKCALKRRGIFGSEFMHVSFPLTDSDRRRIDAALEREREFI